MIEQFSGKYAFLSNFYSCPVTYEDVEYPSAEHAYQAAKTLSKIERSFIRKLQTAAKAKKAGRKVKLRADWDHLKIQVMEEILRNKFTRHTYLQNALLKTEDEILQEGNTWGDHFWGVDLKTKFGENHLGEILMKIRDELKN